MCQRGALARAARNKGSRETTRLKTDKTHADRTQECKIITHTVTHFLVTFSNVALNDVFNFVGNLVISSAVVIGPPVECCGPIRWTEGWLTCFQGHGCYDIQWHDNTAEWKARQYVVQAFSQSDPLALNFQLTHIPALGLHGYTGLINTCQLLTLWEIFNTC